MDIEEIKRRYPDLVKEIESENNEEEKKKLIKALTESIINKPIRDAGQKIAKYFR